MIHRWAIQHPYILIHTLLLYHKYHTLPHQHIHIYTHHIHIHIYTQRIHIYIHIQYLQYLKLHMLHVVLSLRFHMEITST